MTRGKRKLKPSVPKPPRRKGARSNRPREASVRLVQTLRIEAEFLSHLAKLLGSFGILDVFRQAFGSVGLVSVVIGLGHGSTFQRYVPTAFKRFEPTVLVSN